MDRGPPTGVTGAVCQSELDICEGAGVNTGAMLLRVGPWLWDWRRRRGVVVFTVLLEL